MMKGDLFMNLLGFNTYAFIETLPYMGKGMLGIFIVIGIIKSQDIHFIGILPCLRN